MSSDAQAADQLAAEGALDANDPAEALRRLSTYFDGLLDGRGLWLAARGLALSGNSSQALELYNHAFNIDGDIPFVDLLVHGLKIRFRDVPGSKSLLTFARELCEDSYGLNDLDLKPGDVFIDVGANVGFVSTLVAKRFPGTLIFAIEPVPATFQVLLKNLSDNKVVTATAINKAVNASGDDLELTLHPT